VIRPIKALKDRIPNARKKMDRGLMSNRQPILKAAGKRSERMKRGWEMKTSRRISKMRTTIVMILMTEVAGPTRMFPMTDIS